MNVFVEELFIKWCTVIERKGKAAAGLYEKIMVFRGRCGGRIVIPEHHGDDTVCIVK